jgi:hypothetical protein
MFVGFNNKVADGQKYAEAYQITTFTKHIQEKLEEQRYTEAIETLETFNENYASMARQPLGDKNKFIDGLISN